MGATVAAEFLHWSFPQSLGLGTGLSELSATEVGRGGDHSRRRGAEVSGCRIQGRGCAERVVGGGPSADTSSRTPYGEPPLVAGMSSVPKEICFSLADRKKACIRVRSPVPVAE